ncbi:MAG: ComF family protein [Verrucomicrobiaceae bacterium]
MIRKLLDWCFPPLCEVCSTLLDEGHSLCSSCADSLLRIEAPFCRTCGEAFDGQIEGDFDCPNCANLTFAFDFARSPLLATGPARQLIHALKYQSRFYLAPELAPFLMEVLKNDPRLASLPANTVIIPVPLHWWRRQRRHGNQALELARAFSPLSGLPLLPALKRRRATPTQTRLTRKERLSNLKNAFEIRPKDLDQLQDATVLLIDDVFTTGSTAHECARLLTKKAAVKRVIVLTLLRG